MTYKADQEKKNKLLTIAAIVVLFLAVLPIVAFAVFSVVDFKPIPTNKSTVEEPTLSRSEQRKLEREKKKAEEEAAKQTVTQNQPVITTETMPQMGQFPGMGMGFGQGMPQFDPSQFQGMQGGFPQGGFGPGMNNNGAGFMDANGAWNSPPFNPNGGGMNGNQAGPNIIMTDPIQPQPQILPARDNANMINANTANPAGNQQIMVNPLRSEGRPMNP